MGTERLSVRMEPQQHSQTLTLCSGPFPWQEAFALQNVLEVSWGLQTTVVLELQKQEKL